ncbi:NAD(P)-dependent oxidoreductase, partial [Xylophilus sp. ASV27]|uniref:NAD(P)-dependent oxidoreductase n=1 Tax=Xylophilus sp. ASV27 TaxID=2795129 RepID=UPI0018EDF477
MKQRIGMAGIGLMGHGIASNLLKHGYPLTVLEHAGNQPLEALRAAGARTEPSAAALAAGADVVILCVTGTPQVEAVLLGAGGVLQGLRPGTVVIDCSTAIPSSTERVAQAVLQAGGRFLDAPITRTPREAAEGRLNLLVGGDAALFEEYRPLLACFAENITHAGPVGAGHRMKLLHNYVSLGFVALLAEAAACAERAGIAPEVLVDVLAQGGGGGIALERLKPYL